MHILVVLLFLFVFFNLGALEDPPAGDAEQNRAPAAEVRQEAK